MKTESPHLFDFIKSLTEKEKKQFRFFSKSNKNSKDIGYLKLFEIMDAMEEYDEEVIAIKTTRIGLKKNLPTLKSYLYTQLIKSIHFYDEGGSQQELTAKDIVEINILLAKGFRSKAKKKIQEAISNAQNGFNNESLVVLIAKMLEAFTYDEPDVFLDEISELRRVKDQALLQIKHEFECSQYLLRAIYNDMKSRQRSTAENKKQAHALLKELKVYELHFEQFNFKAKEHFTHAMSLCHHIALEYAKNNIYLLKNIELYDEYPKAKELYAEMYSYAISNTINGLVEDKQFEKALQLVVRYDEIKTTNQEHRLEIEIKKTDAEIFICRYMYDYAKVYALLPMFEKNVEKMEETIGRHTVICDWLYIAEACFYLKKYDEVLVYVNQIYIKNNLKRDFRIIAAAKMLHCMTFYEMKKTNALHLQAKNTLSFMKDYSDQFVLQPAICNFFLRFSIIKSAQKIQKDVEKLKAEFAAYRAIKNNVNIGSLFINYEKWIFSLK